MGVIHEEAVMGVIHEEAVMGVVHEEDNAYSIQSTWSCYCLDQYTCQVIPDHGNCQKRHTLLNGYLFKSE